MGAEEFRYLTPQTLSEKAKDLIQFDKTSIRQVVASRHANVPNLWVAAPDQYEHNGRLLRDSTSPRLLGYSPEDKTVYVTDGCNTCAHHLNKDLGALNDAEILAFSQASRIRLELLRKAAKKED